MITWNTLPESYQQRVYNNTLATVKHQMQQAENPTPAVVISIEAAPLDNAIILDCLAGEVVLEEPEIGCTGPNIPIVYDCTDEELHFRMAEGRGDHQNEGDESDDQDTIRSASRPQCPATKHQRLYLVTSVVDGYEGEDGDNADADADGEEESSQVDDGSTQNVED